MIVYIYCNYTFNENDCNVHSKAKKYTIEYRVSPSLGAAFESEGLAIVLNQPDVKTKNVNFKISVVEDKRSGCF